MTYPLTPREDRLRVLRARRDQLDALITRLEDGERQDGNGPATHRALPACGTESGYDRHRRIGEDADEACKAAKRDAERARYAHRKTRRQQRLGKAS